MECANCEGMGTYFDFNGKARTCVSCDGIGQVHIEDYDDVFPVLIMGDQLLDRHNDLIATFDPAVEEIDRQRILYKLNTK